jgi:hypothetical protein
MFICLYLHNKSITRYCGLFDQGKICCYTTTDTHALKCLRNEPLLHKSRINNTWEDIFFLVHVTQHWRFWSEAVIGSTWDFITRTICYYNVVNLGESQIWGSKYMIKSSAGLWTWKRLRWRGPETVVIYKPDLSSERAPASTNVQLSKDC